ncbi:kinesin-like protein KIN-6 isoform X2 [Aristolochia californica]|uniref:kinesin-like protein KIN-6 isoform X2 n=1 Tax=Aristolochia californica TaxID=171875 RepID=UPI0035DAD18E
MDFVSPSPCPLTVTVRRNPRRKVRDTPSTVPDRPVPDPARLKEIPPFPLQGLIESDANPSAPEPSLVVVNSESLHVYLRIKPLDLKPLKNKNGGGVNKKLLSRGNVQKKVEKKNKSNELCLVVNDSTTVTLMVPPSLGSKRVKNVVYEGFSHVFPPNSVQEDVYNAVMDPLVQDFIGGKSGLLAAVGPTGSGKTHTVFGTPREPGLVPRALRQIFNNNKPNEASECSRSYYLSMFEIYSEGGKKEKLCDLSSDGADLSFHQSSIKGLQEIEVSNVVEAEGVIARGMLKRATAETNANNQSSRSQCIITLRKETKRVDNEDEVATSSPVLTIVDLAGAERERKTGNQGARLLESNFINNTSMVFGLCLRSLLEHQKNPKRPLQKHYQNSLLTQYLRDYLEGKKRMTLILTVKSGEEDYNDTSFMLRQASPYMKIKYTCVEEFHDMPHQKRPIAMLTQAEKPKRRRCNEMTETLVDTGKAIADGHLIPTTEISLNPERAKPMNSSPARTYSDTLECSLPTGGDNIENPGMGRKGQIMRDFSRALWNVLKEYKQKFEVSENEVLALRESLKIEKTRVVELEKELKELRIMHGAAEGNHNPMVDHSDSVGVDTSHSKEASASRICESGNQKTEGDDETVSDVAYLKEMLSEANEISSVEKVTGNEKSDPVACHSQSDISLGDGCCLLDPCVNRKPSCEEERPGSTSLLQLPEPLVSVNEEICCNEGPETKEVGEMERKPNSFSKSSLVVKPRRRLLPASSMLLKEISELGVEDECSKNERGKKKNMADGTKSQGSISLVRLLTGNLHL